MLNKIKSNYILKKIIGENLNKKACLNLVLYNKLLQKKLDLSIEDYIKFSSEIVIELIPKTHLEEGEHTFINIPELSKCYFHIYLNNNYTEQQIKNYIK